MNVVIVGCGDVGRRTARHWLAAGCSVHGIVRSARSAATLRELGVTPWQADLDDPESLSVVSINNALVHYFAPPPPQGRRDERMRGFLRALDTQRPAKVVYLSTTAVYGDRGGATVSEGTPPDPQTDRGHRRWDAEQVLRAWCAERNTHCVVLRVGGIYGPGRLPLERIRAGIPVLREALAPATNRIHADDLAQVCIAAAERGGDGSVYNVSDGQPGNMTEYFYAVADAAGLARPPAVDWDEAARVMSPGMLSYLRESRRLDTSRMRKELGVELRYPTLAAGLASCPELHDRQ